MDMMAHEYTFVVSLVVIPMCKTVPQGEIKLTSKSRKCMGVNGEALQLHVVHKKPYFFLLQVT